MLAAGQTIGNYRVLAKIGTGGMGAVYLAEHPLIGKKVALKVIHKDLATNKEIVQRFFQEARAVNTIGNEHIVEVHDFGVSPDGHHFFIMEYLEGRTLASVLTHEPMMDVRRALRIGAQIASALAACHAAGVIHRDLKPDNVMLIQRLGNPEFVKVLDFGLAKMLAGGGGNSAVQTGIGVLLGTPQYMSPEACESKREVDHRTDIYALGVLLFQMLTGQLPFDGATMGEVLVKQVAVLPPAPRGFNPAIPPSVEQILLRCLAKPPEARFQTMEALRIALLDPDAYLHASPPIAPARSVAPGEARGDAAAVRAHAEARAKAAAAAPGATNDRTLIHGAHLAPTTAPSVVTPGAPRQPALKMNTMRIDTPLGYTSRPARRVWPVVLAVGLVLGIGFGTFAVVWFGGGGAAGGDAGSATVGSASGVSRGNGVGGGSGVGSGSGSGVGVGGGSGGGSGSGVGVGSGAGAAPASADAQRVRIVIESVPAGASVYRDARLLGQTPLTLDVPTSTTPRRFILKLRGYRERAEEVRATEDVVTTVRLERVPATGGGASTGTGRSGDRTNHGTNNTGLERPE